MKAIPKKLRSEMAADPFYTRCARNEALHDHVCQCDPLTGRLIEWEHAMIIAGNQVQEKWAIIPLCWWAHRGPGMVKEINIWIALNRASLNDLWAISKRFNYRQYKIYLDEKYGVYNPVENALRSSGKAVSNELVYSQDMDWVY